MWPIFFISARRGFLLLALFGWFIPYSRVLTWKKQTVKEFTKYDNLALLLIYLEHRNIPDLFCHFVQREMIWIYCFSSWIDLEVGLNLNVFHFLRFRVRQCHHKSNFISDSSKKFKFSGKDISFSTLILRIRKKQLWLWHDGHLPSGGANITKVDWIEWMMLRERI